MNKLEDWQPLFRFLKRLDESYLVGIAFSAVYLIGVIAAWYWVLFKDGAETWRTTIILWNRRFGVNTEWVTPFILKVSISILLIGSVVGLSMVLFTKITKQGG